MLRKKSRITGRSDSMNSRYIFAVSRSTPSSSTGWSETVTAQVSVPRARYLGRPPARIRVDAEPEADRKADAEAQSAAAKAVTDWRALGVDVDTEAAADAARVPRRMTPAP